MKFDIRALDAPVRDCPAPHGAGGLKSGPWRGPERLIGPAPHGAGGLKYPKRDLFRVSGVSRPARGGWIEIDEYFRHVLGG